MFALPNLEIYEIKMSDKIVIIEGKSLFLGPISLLFDPDFRINEWQIIFRDGCWREKLQEQIGEVEIYKVLI